MCYIRCSDVYLLLHNRAVVQYYSKFHCNSNSGISAALILVKFLKDFQKITSSVFCTTSPASLLRRHMLTSKIQLQGLVNMANSNCPHIKTKDVVSGKYLQRQKAYLIKSQTCLVQARVERRLFFSP